MEENISNQRPKRPDGIIIISILWALAAIYNLYSGFSGVTSNVPLLSTGQLAGWFSFAVPSAVVLSTVVMMVAVVQLITCGGLWVGKYYAAVSARVLVIVLPVVNLLFGVLYFSAPQELGFSSEITMSLVLCVGGAVWAVFYWGYLKRDYVKAFLNK